MTVTIIKTASNNTDDVDEYENNNDEDDTNKNEDDTKDNNTLGDLACPRTLHTTAGGGGVGPEPIC